MVTVTEAGTAQLPVIHDLACKIWPDAFREILSTAQIAYMLEWMYSIPSLSAQLSAGHRFLLAGTEPDFLGYASFQALENPSVVKLHKIYVLASARGKGAGAALMSEVIRRAREMGTSRIRLNVNRFNNAVGFYEKLGFRIIGTEDNDIGHGYFMNDYVMELVV